MLKKESLCERLSTAFPSQTSKGIQVHFIHFRRFSSRLRKDGGRKSGIVWKVKILLRKGPVSSDGGTNGNSANVFAFFFFFLIMTTSLRMYWEEKKPFLLRSYQNFAMTLGLELPDIWKLWNQSRNYLPKPKVILKAGNQDLSSQDFTGCRISFHIYPANVGKIWGHCFFPSCWLVTSIWFLLCRPLHR